VTGGAQCAKAYTATGTSAVNTKGATDVATTRTGQRLNGMDVDELREYIDSVTADAAQADRDPMVTARWVGGNRAEVTSTLGGPPLYMGGDHDPSAMGILLRPLRGAMSRSSSHARRCSGSRLRT
jgi:hypothetical protein